MTSPLTPSNNYKYYTLLEIASHVYMANLVYQTIMNGENMSTLNVFMGYLCAFGLIAGVIDHCDKYFYGFQYESIQFIHKPWKQIFVYTVVLPTFIGTIYLVFQVTFIDNCIDGISQFLVWSCFIAQSIFSWYVFGVMDKSKESFEIAEVFQHITDIVLYTFLMNAIQCAM